MSSHNSPECDGRWIDISTLAQRKVLCLKCRATVDGVSDPDDERLAAPRSGEPPTELQEATEAGRSGVARGIRAAYFAAGFLVGLGLAALVS